MATIYDIISGDENYSVLKALVDLADTEAGADLRPLLDSDDDLDESLFAPTNAAFLALATSLGFTGTDAAGAVATVQAVLTEVGDGDPFVPLVQILKYHVVQANLGPADYAAGSDIAGSATLLPGTVLSFSGGALVDGADSTPDVMPGTYTAADNGGLISINAVLLPFELVTPIDPPVVPSPGDDVITGTDGDDFIMALAGNDSVDGGKGDDHLRGNLGDDTLRGRQGDDSLSGGRGDDALVGGIGNDIAFGDGGDDWIKGNAGNDRLVGRRGEDKLFGGNGNDNLNGGSGDDMATGGNGNDKVWGNSGDDTVEGGNGNDTVGGGSGNDIVRGGNGDDLLLGGGGDDTIGGGPGNDTLIGGDGADQFNFDTSKGARIVADFEVGTDTLKLSDLGGAGTYTMTPGSGDGNDLLITTDANPDWSILLLDIDSIA